MINLKWLKYFIDYRFKIVNNSLLRYLNINYFNNAIICLFVNDVKHVIFKIYINSFSNNN
jgi:hypothetical protein